MPGIVAQLVNNSGKGVWMSVRISWAVVSYSDILQGGLNITMTIETMAREFRYDGLRLPDPNAKLSVDEVRTAFSATYPEIATAAVTGPEAVGNKLVYHFTKAIGTKG